MNYDLINLESFLKKSSIPVVKKAPTTFLGISKQPHYENVLSNIYAFFFNIDAEHNLHDLFLQSLLQIIEESINFKFYYNSSFKVETEFITKSNGRIDLLLLSDNDAIIIENKVYHYLNNDLSDYWDSIERENKIGIILSLYKTGKNQIYHPNFVGITHLELLNKVVNNLSNYFLNASEKYIIFFKDFYQNIVNTTNLMDPKIISFFCQNQEAINSIVNIRKNYISYVISKVEAARIDIDEKLELYGSRNESFRYYTCPNQSNLMITVFFENLFTKKQTLSFIVELKNELLKETEKIKNIEFDDDEKKYIKSDFSTYKISWVHFATQLVEPNEDDITNLREYISKCINDGPILNIYRKLKTKLVNNI